MNRRKRKRLNNALTRRYPPMTNYPKRGPLPRRMGWGALAITLAAIGFAIRLYG